ncbi:hypothetical protein ACS0TY_012704 [Phlomoides rotata]
MDARDAEHGTEKLRNRNEKGRRGWSMQEEQVLCEAMKQIVREGWRTENGFKTGYLKKNYHSLFEILKHTGVGLDSTTKMVEATDEQWSGFMKCEIFGCSRATGEGAESHVNINTPHPSVNENVDLDEESNRVNDETMDESQSPTVNVQTGEYTEMGRTSSGRKRKAPTTSDPFVDVVQNFCDGASSRLGEIAQRIGHDHDMSSARKLIYSLVSKMNMLTLQEKLRATTLIMRHNEHIDVFFSLLDDDRMEWVLMLLNGDI